MKKNKVLNILGIISMFLLITLGAIGTSIYSKRNTPSEKSKINFYFDMTKWNYDEKNNVYYQLNVDYCEKSKINENQKFDIFVPGEYLISKKNSDGTYDCSINKKGKKERYNAESAPMIIAIQEEEIEQIIHKNYNYEEVSNFVNEGYIYIWPGTRGIKNGEKANSNEEYSNAIIDGVTDLKALVRFCRFNKQILPGDTEKILAYGINGGGTKSAILGASGDSELYSSRLLTIGAIISNNEGKGISDSVNGAMCCSPVKNSEIEKIAYDWYIGQYLKIESNEKNCKESALQYANYINNMKLKSEEGSLLYLDETKQNVYTNGTYYNYIKTEIEKTINSFLQNTIFPYKDLKKDYIFETTKEYIKSLNVNSEWIMYDENTNTVRITSFKDLANNCCNDNNTINERTSLNEYNPYYYLSNKYNGLDSSYISRNWNICTLIDENYKSFLPEENLKLILQKNEDVKNIKHTCIWAINYSDEAKHKIQLDNLKSWINECFNY